MVIKYFGVLGALLMLQTSVLTQPNLFKQQKGETNYGQVGPYCIHNDLSSEERNRILGEIRQFLWDHWTRRQSGRVTVVFYTIEGDPTLSTFFIEQDQKGRWRVGVNSESTISSGLRKRKQPRREVIEETYDIVERVEDLSGRDPATAPALPELQIRLPQTYKLRLKSTTRRARQRPTIIL